MNHKRKNGNISLQNRLFSLALTGIVLASILLLSVGCREKKRSKTFYGWFGTVCVLSDYSGGTQEEFAHSCEVFAETMEYYHRLFDIYHEYEDVVNLAAVNRLGGQYVSVPSELVRFLRFCLRMGDETDGRMNIVLGSVLSLWHEAREAQTPRLPDAEALTAANAFTDPSLLEIGDDCVRLAAGASLDVGAVGKGYAVSQAVERLKEAGAKNLLINAGGTVVGIGERTWRVGIQDPTKTNGSVRADACILEYTSNLGAVSTSGSLEQYMTVDGKRYSHIIDPDTLYPAEYLAAVTVIHPDGGTADALSTALFTLTYEEGLSLIRRRFPEASVLWILPDGTQKAFGVFTKSCN